MITSDLFHKGFPYVPGHANVYIISVDKNRNLLSSYNEYLSVDEKNKASRFKFKIDQERSIISRAILRILSGNFLKKDPRKIQFIYGEQGKPDFLVNQRLNFNLSHSGDMIVIGFVEDHEIGIDIEFVKTDFDVLKLAQNFFSNIEIASLEKLPKEELLRAFFRCWTRKESFIKAEGSGLSFPLDKFSVSINSDNSAELLQTDWDLSERLNWNLFSFSPNTQYVGALAVRNKLSRVQYFDWDVLVSDSKPTSNHSNLDS